MLTTINKSQLTNQIPHYNSILYYFLQETMTNLSLHFPFILFFKLGFSLFVTHFNFINKDGQNKMTLAIVSVSRRCSNKGNQKQRTNDEAMKRSKYPSTETQLDQFTPAEPKLVAILSPIWHFGWRLALSIWDPLDYILLPREFILNNKIPKYFETDFVRPTSNIQQSQLHQTLSFYAIRHFPL